jgi:hypothetical protein
MPFAPSGKVEGTMYDLSSEEERQLALRLSTVSDVLDYDAALGLIRSDDKFLGVKKALELIEARESTQKQQEELDRNRARLQAAAVAR